MVNSVAGDRFRRSKATLETLAAARIDKARRKSRRARNPYFTGIFANV